MRKKYFVNVGLQVMRLNMVEAVRAHREIPEKAETLGDIIAIADKRTRLCMMCNAIDTCKWSENEKNTDIVL